MERCERVLGCVECLCDPAGVSSGVRQSADEISDGIDGCGVRAAAGSVVVVAERWFVAEVFGAGGELVVKLGLCGGCAGEVAEQLLAGRRVG